jgi:N utilization substance protein B
MQALYARELAGGKPRHHVYTLIEPEFEDDPNTLDFAQSLFETTARSERQIDNYLEAHLQNWDLDRISAIDRAVLRMATCELLHFEDVPPKVTIDEAIEIVKRFSTLKSGDFVNGVLDAVLMELYTSGDLNKTGRGRVGLDAIAERASQT